MVSGKQIFTLKQVVSSIRKTIEERYQQLYWVKAEMHKLNRFPSGHCFPELLQKEDGKVVAQISASIWKQNFERINRQFIEVVKEPLKEDSTLLLQVKITYHEVYGMSLQILDIDPAYSLGELHKERAETLKKLKAENLLNANQSLPFPLLPKRIAVISAESSKGLSDFNQVLDNNQWGYSYFRMLFQAYLQGDLASASIIGALKKIELVKDHFDVVVIVRGGGGEVGLSCYNDYELCRAIASFPLPVLTGIGHSTNMTVAEMIAYRNAITPTELGEFFIQAFHSFSVPLKDAIETVRIFATQMVSESKHALSRVSTTFQHVTQRRVKVEQQLLAASGVNIRSGLRFRFMELKEGINACRISVVHEGRRALDRERTAVLNATDKLASGSIQFIRRNELLTRQLEQSVRLMDPVNVLNRGYSITTLNSKVLSKSNQAQKGDIILTRTADFELKSNITEINEEHE